MAQYMHHDVPGVTIPKKLLARMEAAGEDGAMEEGVQIALELIEQIKAKEPVSGIHLMPVAWESVIPRLVEEAGLLPPDFKQPVEDPAPAT